MAKKPVVVHIDKDDANADWIKWRSRESELAVHDMVADELARRRQEPRGEAEDEEANPSPGLRKAKKAALEAKAAVLKWQIERGAAEVKHLQGKHNQKDHGRGTGGKGSGGGGAVSWGKELISVMNSKKMKDAGFRAAGMGWSAFNTKSKSSVYGTVHEGFQVRVSHVPGAVTVDVSQVGPGKKKKYKPQLGSAVVPDALIRAAKAKSADEAEKIIQSGLKKPADGKNK